MRKSGRWSEALSRTSKLWPTSRWQMLMLRSGSAFWRSKRRPPKYSKLLRRPTSVAGRGSGSTCVPLVVLLVALAYLQLSIQVAYNAQTEKESPAKKKGPSLSSGDEFGLADDDEDSGDDDFHARLTKDDRLIDPHAPAGPRKLPSAVSVSRSASGTPQPLIPLHLGHPESSKSGKLKQKSKPKPSPMALGNLRQAQDPQVAGPSRRSSSNLLSRSPSYLQAVGSSRPSSNACHLPSSPANLIAEQKRLAEIHGLVVAAQVLRDAELDKLIAAAKGTPPGEQSAPLPSSHAGLALTSAPLQVRASAEPLSASSSSSSPRGRRTRGRLPSLRGLRRLRSQGLVLPRSRGTVRWRKRFLRRREVLSLRRGLDRLRSRKLVLPRRQGRLSRRRLHQLRSRGLVLLRRRRT